MSFALLAPSLVHGLLLDDLWHRIYLSHATRWGPIPRPWWDLFSFYDRDPARGSWMAEQGISPWWSDRSVVLSFFRPLSSLTHALDHALWPDSPLLMRLHSALWYAALVTAAGALYQRALRDRRAASLATIAFAIDPAHGIPASWVANRNALIAALFGVLTVLAHARWRDARRPSAAWAPTALFALSLLSGESGVATLAYLVAWAASLEEGSVSARLRSLAPYALVTAVWAVGYRLGGFGARHSGMYVDPSHDLARFVSEVTSNALLLVGAEWGSVLPDAIVVEAWLRGPFVVGAAMAVTLAVVAMAPALRVDRGLRMLALGGALAVLPSCATIAGSRLLTLPSAGLVAVAAASLSAVIDRAEWVPPGGVRRSVTRAFGYWAGGVRLALSPLLLVVVSQQMWVLHRSFERLSETLPADGAPLESQRVIYVNAPDGMFTGYVSVIRDYIGRPVPGAFLVLASGTRPVEIERRDDATLRIRQPGGFWRATTDTLMRAPSIPMRLGERVTLSDVTVEVTHMTADRVADEVVFRFARPLEHARWRWVEWRRDRFVTFTPPRVGSRVTLAPQRLLPSML